MTRRALLRRILLAAAAPALGTITLTSSTPTAVTTWRWVPLPGTGLEVCLTEPTDPRRVACSWTDGAVTAFGVTVTAGPTPVTVIIGTRSISVRRILT